MSVFGGIVNGVLGLLTGGSAKKAEAATALAEERRRNDMAIKAANDRAHDLQMAQARNQTQSGGKDNNMMILGIGGAIVVLMGVMFTKK